MDKIDKLYKLVNILSVSLLSVSIVVYFTVVRYLMVNKVVYKSSSDFAIGRGLT